MMRAGITSYYHHHYLRVIFHVCPQQMSQLAKTMTVITLPRSFETTTAGQARYLYQVRLVFVVGNIRAMQLSPMPGSRRTVCFPRKINASFVGRVGRDRGRHHTALIDQPLGLIKRSNASCIAGRFHGSHSKTLTTDIPSFAHLSVMYLVMSMTVSVSSISVSLCS